jgi:hypothetical protein
MAREVYYILAQNNAAKVGFVSPSDYATIGSVVGVAKAVAADEVILSRVGDLLRSGQVLRMKVRYKEGTVTKSGSILCDIDKATTALAGLRGKAYSGGVIQSASIPRRRRLG